MAWFWFQRKKIAASSVVGSYLPICSTHGCRERMKPPRFFFSSSLNLTWDFTFDRSLNFGDQNKYSLRIRGDEILITIFFRRVPVQTWYKRGKNLNIKHAKTQWLRREKKISKLLQHTTIVIELMKKTMY